MIPSYSVLFEAGFTMKFRWILCLIFYIFTIQGEPVYKVISLKQFCLAQTLLKTQHRTALINYIIIARNYQSYLEIGTCSGSTLNAVTAVHKVGVDPFPYIPCDFQMTSDEFFAINRETFDIIFIDGCHLYEQVLRDVANSLKCLNPGGIIVMHDCLPQRPEHQYRIQILSDWNGDVWKAAAYIRMHFKDAHFCVLDMDWGCGLITPHSTQNLYPSIPIGQLDWKYYIDNRDELLNVVSVNDWIRTFE